MKLNFWLTIFVLFCKNRVSKGEKSEKDIKIGRAKEAKTEYNIDREKEGFGRLRNALPEEKKLSRILQWILFEQICLRWDTDASNSCYALSDFSLEPSENWNKFENWLSAPYSKEEPTLQWFERLYNSVAFMLLTENSKEINLALGTKSGHGVGERESIPPNVDIGIGNSKTFSKGFITGEEIEPKLTINVLESLADMKTTISKVLGMVEEAYDKNLSKIAQ